MTDQPLLVIIPARGRPEAISKIVEAWDKTGAWEVAEPLFVIDFDDPKFYEYQRKLVMHGVGTYRTVPQWRPMVAKLDSAAIDRASYYGHRHIGFAGDDHLPRTPGWAQGMVAALDAMGTGVVYPDDGYQHEKLASSWAMSADIIRALGRMVPAPVEHLYCDNSIMDLARAIDRLRYLPDVLVEHMHPVAGKVVTDEQYERVNGREQYRKDRPAYKRWRSQGGLQRDARAVADLLRESV
jgi:hypothetical protein